MKCFQWLTSLKLTLFCLIGLMLLVFLGTLEQISTGLLAAQKKYFHSIFLYWGPVPYFPGGLFFSTLLILNLAASFVSRFKFRWKSLGIWLIHLGLVVLIVGEIMSAWLTVESQMVIREGQVANYSFDTHQLELVIINSTDPEHDQVVAIGQQSLYPNNRITHSSLPFSLHIVQCYPNSRFEKLGEDIEPVATRGWGTKVSVIPHQPTLKDDERNLLSVFVTLADKEQNALGTWLLSNAISASQTLEFGGRQYELLVRNKRYYFPFSLELVEFIHELHPNTNIPKEFASKVNVFGADGDLEREARIYMNHPLRYQGKTFYQASFGENNTTSVLQVVDNPSRLTPYISSGLVCLGLAVQFSMSFFSFRRRKK